MTVIVAQERSLGERPAGADRWIYLGERPAWSTRAQRELLNGLPRIEIAGRMAEIAEQLRQPYIDWIGELGAVNDSAEWWASELAAKNVYTFLFQRLCWLAVALEEIADSTLFITSSAALAEQIASAARARSDDVVIKLHENSVRHRIGTAGLRAWASLPHWRPRMPAAGYVDTLLVTWADERSFDDYGHYQDPHLGPLAEMLRAEGREVALLARILPTAKYRQTVRRLARCGERIFLPESFLTATDRRRCWKQALQFSPKIPDCAAVGGVPATALARELVSQTTQSLSSALTYDPLFEDLAAAGLRPSSIIFPWEGHAWETAMVGAIRKQLPRAEIVAYDNLNFSRFALSLFPSANERALRPLADRFVTNGDTFAGILRSEGFLDSQVSVGCALRHGAMYQSRAAEARDDNESRYVLAAGSIDAEQTIEMVETAFAAFGSELLVKLHPASAQERITDALDPAVRYSDKPIEEILSAARAMIYTYSAVPYEALHRGVPPVHFRSQSLLSLDQLEPTAKFRGSGTTVDELRSAVARGEEDARRPEWLAHSAGVVTEALKPSDPSCVRSFLNGEPCRTQQPQDACSRSKTEATRVDCADAKIQRNKTND
jgi:hypothetical protein